MVTNSLQPVTVIRWAFLLYSLSKGRRNNWIIHFGVAIMHILFESFSWRCLALSYPHVVVSDMIKKVLLHLPSKGKGNFYGWQCVQFYGVFGERNNRIFRWIGRDPLEVCGPLWMLRSVWKAKLVIIVRV